MANHAREPSRPSGTRTSAIPRLMQVAPHGVVSEPRPRSPAVSVGRPSPVFGRGSGRGTLNRTGDHDDGWKNGRSRVRGEGCERRSRPRDARLRVGAADGGGGGSCDGRSERRPLGGARRTATATASGEMRAGRIDLIGAMGGTGISKSQVSRLCVEIDERVQAVPTRPLEGTQPCFRSDATCLRVRDGGRIAGRAAAIAVNDDGHREGLGVCTGPSEAEVFRMDLLRTLADRGQRGVQLVGAGDHKGCGLRRAGCLTPLIGDAACTGCATRWPMRRGRSSPCAQQGRRCIGRSNPAQAADARSAGSLWRDLRLARRGAQSAASFSKISSSPSSRSAEASGPPPGCATCRAAHARASMPGSADHPAIDRLPA